MDYLTGKEYSWLCDKCKTAIDDIAHQFNEGLMPDSDDPEAPAMFVYDRGLYCGGKECINKDISN